VVGAFLAGLAVGIFVGLLLGPLLRAAVALREYRRASAEAELTDELLRRIEASTDSSASPGRGR
jgi:hypothetical protein